MPGLSVVPALGTRAAAHGTVVRFVCGREALGGVARATGNAVPGSTSTVTAEVERETDVLWWPLAAAASTDPMAVAVAIVVKRFMCGRTRDSIPSVAGRTEWGRKPTES